MKALTSLFEIVLAGILVGFVVPSVKAAPELNHTSILVNRIEGVVWSPYRRPVPDLYVELQNENYFAIAKTRTTSTGRFNFSGIPGGHYNIKVLTTGTNYLEHTEGFDLVNVVRGGSDSVYLEIFLKFDKRKTNDGASVITGAVFVQEVPEQARKLYKKGVDALRDKGEKGFIDIEESLKIFPNYYDALNTLGTEYVARKEYQKALAYLIRAIDINRRSFSSFYALAYACYQLNHRNEALQAARAATILQPASLNSQLLYGTVLRLQGRYEEAEKALLAAKKLGKDTRVPEVHWQLALLFNKLGRNREAADELELYLEINPDAPDKRRIRDLIAKLRRDSKQKFVNASG